MPAVATHALLDASRAAASPLLGAPEDFDPVLALVSDGGFYLRGISPSGTRTATFGSCDARTT